MNELVFHNIKYHQGLYRSQGRCAQINYADDVDAALQIPGFYFDIIQPKV